MHLEEYNNLIKFTAAARLNKWEIWQSICEHLDSKQDLFQIVLVNHTMFKAGIGHLWRSMIINERRLEWLHTLIPDYTKPLSADEDGLPPTASRSTLKRTVSAVVGEQDRFLSNAVTPPSPSSSSLTPMKQSEDPQQCKKSKVHEEFNLSFDHPPSRPAKYGRLVRSLSVQPSIASSTAATDCLADCLPHLPQLRHLNAAGCLFLDHRITQSISVHCADTLQAISLAHCDSITDDSIVQLTGAARNLRDVCLTRCSMLTDRSMTAMAGSLHRLIRLCVAKLPLISADGVNRVAKDCRDLQSLDLTRCGAVESQALRVGLFQFGSSLRSLNLSALSSSGTDADIELLVTNCLLLEELSLERWSRLTDRAVIVIGGRLRNLERLNLTFLHRITSDGLRQFARLCSRRLFELFLGKCSNITNEGIIQLSQNTPQLRRIYLAGCRVITDEAILQLIQCCSQLEVLSVPGCSITDVTVVAAAKHLHQTLNVAQFSFCPDVSPMAICRLAHACRRLEILQLVQCRRVLDSFVLEYSQPCPVHLLSRYEGIYCAIRPPNIRRLGLRYLASQRTYTI